MMEAGSPTFQTVKPVCIRLNQAALSFPSGRATTADVVKAQLDLQQTLTFVAHSAPQDLDRKLAEYIFFPLSHVLRQHPKLPSVALESCLQCVLLLLQSAWRSHIEPKLGVQLLILLTILVDPDGPSEQKLNRTEDFENIAYWCFAEDFKALRRTKDGRRELLATSNVPYLGKAIFEILHGATSGASQNVQLSALTALRAFIDVVDDREALSVSFLPGIVSAAQKILLPKTSSPRAYKVLVECLIVLSSLLRRVLSDDATKDLAEPAENGKAKENSKSRLDKSWLRATASQVKMVLATVMKLRSHSRTEVRQALLQFCMDLVKDCRKSLSESIPFIIETILTLVAGDGNDRTKSVFTDLLRSDESLVELLEDSLYNWIVSLPRVMQSSDEAKKRTLIAQISGSYQLLSDLDVNLSRIVEVLASHLRDSVATTLLEAPAEFIREPVAQETSGSEVALVLSDRDSQTWNSIISLQGAQKAALEDLTHFAAQLATYEQSASLIKQLVDEVSQGDGPLQVASFWTALQMVRPALEHNADVNSLVNMQSESQELVEVALETLYDLSLDVISTSATVSGQYADWRVQALALETIALEASQLGVDFRDELVEALFPVVQFLGSSNNFLRRHAMTCLNIIATACEYRDARDLIISNVDYLTNAIALQMNSYEISVQSPQVLLMMVKLTGPRLLPYLDDTVESMFGALEQYHGYTKLAEALFSVLLAIAQEGAKTEQLAITKDEGHSRRVVPRDPLAIGSLEQTLKGLRRKREEDNNGIEELSHESFPQRPWKEAAKEPPEEDPLADFELDGEDEDAVDHPPGASLSDAEARPPVPKTYSILLKISNLTQHYLTSSSPAFRTSLLSLLHTTLPALAKHENSLLPLINTLWPVVVLRLDDTEAYVVANALETIACMCQYAGNFMRSRITELWEELKSIARKRANLGEKRQQKSKASKFGAGRQTGNEVAAVKKREGQSRTIAGSVYVDVPTRLLSESLVKFLVVMVDHVEIDDDIFDEALDMLTPYLERSDVRGAMERRNADAVWLVLQSIHSSGSDTIKPEAQVLTKSLKNETSDRWDFPELPE